MDNVLHPLVTQFFADIESKLRQFLFSVSVCSLPHYNILQVRLCREKATSNVYAMKKLKKFEMLRRGQVFHDVYSCQETMYPSKKKLSLFHCFASMYYLASRDACIYISQELLLEH
jgi:hypothetical protein